MKLELVATCLFGLEHLLGEEIEALGYERISTIDGRITFLGDEEAVALSNIFLRYAERVFIKLGPSLPRALRSCLRARAHLIGPISSAVTTSFPSRDTR